MRQMNSLPIDLRYLFWTKFSSWDGISETYYSSNFKSLQYMQKFMIKHLEQCYKNIHNMLPAATTTWTDGWTDPGQSNPYI